MILAAGYATRLYPLTLNFPKALLDVAGRSILDRLVDDVNCVDALEQIVVVSNARYFDSFLNWSDSKAHGLEGLKQSRVPIEVLNDGTESNAERLGAVKDILFALESFESCDDWLVMAGDNLLDFSIATFVDYFLRRDSHCIMRYWEDDQACLSKCGVLELADDDRVVSMEEKPEQPRSNWCVPPFYAYRNLSPERLRDALANGCGYDAPGSLPAFLASREPVYAMEMPGRRFDVGDLESYRRVKELFLKNQQQ